MPYPCKFDIAVTCRRHGNLSRLADSLRAGHDDHLEVGAMRTAAMQNPFFYITARRFAPRLAIARGMRKDGVPLPALLEE